MHRKVMEFLSDPKIPDGRRVVAAANTDIYGDVPEDSDVMLVLARHPAMPQIVTAGGHNFKISIDGSIEDLGPVKSP
jgi:hypothetical protein